MSYRIDVVNQSVAEAVRHAGGLIFDRSRAGWRVRVVIDDAANSRALSILGACAGLDTCIEADEEFCSRILDPALEHAVDNRPRSSSPKLVGGCPSG